jgi:putative flavoprotein involved in K+ transport
MDGETVETLVIGGGQAGIAMGEHLGRHGLPHLILERARIASAGARNAGIRWLPMARHGDRFPGQTFERTGPTASPAGGSGRLS